MRASPRRRRGTARTRAVCKSNGETAPGALGTGDARWTALPPQAGGVARQPPEVRGANHTERIQAIARIAIRCRRSNNWNGYSVSSPVPEFSMSMRFAKKAGETATGTSVRWTGKPSANQWTRTQFSVAPVLRGLGNDVPAIQRKSLGAADKRTLMRSEQGTEVSDLLEEPTATPVSKLPHCHRHAGQALEEAR